MTEPSSSAVWTTRTAPPADADPPAPPETVPPLGARIGVLVAGVSGVLALFSTGLIASPYAAVFAVLCALLIAAAAWAPVLWPSPGGTTVRRVLSFALLAITLTLFLSNLVRMQPSDIVDLAVTFGGFLGRLLISVLLAQLFVTDKMRDLRVALAIAAGMFVLALGNDPGWFAVVALLVGWPAVVTTLAFDHAVRDRSKADSVAVTALAPVTPRPSVVAEVPAPFACSAWLSSVPPSIGWVRVGWFSAVSGLVAVLLVLLLPHPTGIRPDQVGGVAGAAPRSRSRARQRATPARTRRGPWTCAPVGPCPTPRWPTFRSAVPSCGEVRRSTTTTASAGVPPPTARTAGRWLGVRTSTCPANDATTGTGVQRRDVVHPRSRFTGVLLARVSRPPSTCPARSCSCPAGSSWRRGQGRTQDAL